MDSAWIGMIGTLAGAALVGGLALISKWLEISSQERRDTKQRLLENLEDLHLRVERYRGNCSDYLLFNRIRRETSAKGLTHDDLVRLLNPMREPLPELWSIQRRYAPEFSKEFTNMLNEASELYQQAIVVMANPSSVGECQKILNRLTQNCDTFNRQVEKKIARISGLDESESEPPNAL